MTKRASGRELDPNLIPIVADLTPAQIRQAGVNTVGYCQANGIGRDELVDLLGALGIAPVRVSRKPRSAEERRKAAERQAAYERRTKEAS